MDDIIPFRMDAGIDTETVAEMEKKQAVKDVSEIYVPRPSRSWTYWLVLFFAVAPIWSLVPLSWAYVIYILRTGKVWTLGWKGYITFGWALAEVGISSHIMNIDINYCCGP